jgi:DNA-binding Lrp family transcriptional regulator
MESVSKKILNYINEKGYIEADFKKLSEELNIPVKRLNNSVLELAKAGVIDYTKILSSKDFNINDRLNTLDKVSTQSSNKTIDNETLAIMNTFVVNGLINVCGKTPEYKDQLISFWNNLLNKMI